MNIPKAKDLSYDAKQQILEQIRKQVGDSAYCELVNRSGEDGLIELAFTAAAASTEDAKKKEKRESRWTIFYVVFVLLLFCGLFFDTTRNACFPLLLVFIVLPTIGCLWDVIKESLRIN